MKNLKMLLVLAILSISFASFAQPPGGGGRGGKQQAPKIPSAQEIEEIVSDLSTELELTAKQETLVLEMYKNHFAEVRIKMEGQNKPSREEMQTLEANFKFKVLEIFNEEQKIKYNAYLEEHKPKQGRH